MKLCSVLELKNFLEIPPDQVEFDELLESIIKAVSARIERALNRKLKKEQRTEYFTAGKKVYSLSAYPIDKEAGLTVEVWGSERTDYVVYPESGLIEFINDTGIPWPKKVAVTYTGGYEEVNGILQVPDDLKQACIMQAAFLFKRRKDIGLRSVSMPDGSISVQAPTKLLPEVEEIIKSYRRMPYG